MAYRSRIKQRTLNTKLNSEIRSLLHLPNFSLTVRKLLEGWVAIRRFLHREDRHNLTLSNFQPIQQNEYVFLDRLLESFEAEVAKDQEFQTASDPSKGAVQDRSMYHSIRLQGEMKGNFLLYPWHIFSEIRHNDDIILLETLLDQLAKFPSLRCLPKFIDTFVASRGRISVKRSDLSVRFLQALTDPYYATSEHYFPTQADLQKVLNCSERAIFGFEKGYSDLTVIQARYLVNMGRLGFQGVRVVHQTPLDARIQPFVLRCHQMGPNTFVSILYLPPSSDLINYLPTEIVELSQYCIARNFEQLHAKPEKSWQLPNRLLGDSPRVRAPQRGIWFDLTPNPNPSPRPLTDFKILDRLQFQSPGAYSTLASLLGISEKHVRRRLKIFLEEGILAPFYFIWRIGLDSTVLVTFAGNVSAIEKLKNDLLSFPYAEMLTSPTGGNITLLIPNAWMTTLFDDIRCLRENDVNVWVAPSYPVVSQWGIPLTDLVQNDAFFGPQWIVEEE